MNRGIWGLLVALTLLTLGCPWGQGGKKHALATGYKPKGVDSIGFGQLRILMNRTEHPLVSVRLFMEGGVTNFPPDWEGIEQLVLMSTLQGGSGKWGGAAVGIQTEAAGARLFGRASMDYSMWGLDCHLGQWRPSWALFQEMVLHPSFDSLAVEEQKELAIGAAKSQERDGQRLARQLAREGAFSGNPYSKRVEGSAKSLGRFKPSDLRHYYQDFLLSKCRVWLVITSPLDAEAVVDRVLEGLDGLPLGNCDPLAPFSTTPKVGGYRLAQLASPFHYFHGIFPAPPRGSKLASFRIGLGILEDRFKKILVEEKSVAQDFGIGLEMVKYPYGTLRMTTASPSKCLGTFLDAMGEILTNGLAEGEIQREKATLRTLYGLAMEDPRSQTEALGEAAVFGNWRDFGMFPEQIVDVELEEVNAVLREYLVGASWGFAGDSLLVPKAKLGLPFHQP